MTPKPLSKERLKYIRQTMEIIEGFGKPSREPKADEIINQLLAAEQYWREAVKNADESSDSGPSSGMCYTCNFCNADSRSVNGGSDHTIDHKPECPWLLAQEAE
jgi:hypothetical protein